MKLKLIIDTSPPKQLEAVPSSRGELALPQRKRVVGTESIKPMIVSALCISIASILCVPQLSARWDKLPPVKVWQSNVKKLVAGTPVSKNSSFAPQQKPIFPLKYRRILTGVPNDCRPVAVCRRLGLQKYSANFRGIRPHAGVDFAAPVSTPVLAVIDLKISGINPDSSAGGIVSAESIDGKQYFRFIHLDRNSVRRIKTGQVFKQGQTIALIGFENNGGWGTGPHLHLERYIKVGKEWKLDTEIQDWIP